MVGAAAGVLLFITVVAFTNIAIGVDPKETDLRGVPGFLDVVLDDPRFLIGWIPGFLLMLACLYASKWLDHRIGAPFRHMPTHTRILIDLSILAVVVILSVTYLYWLFRPYE